MGHAGRRVLGEAAHVDFVNDRVFVRRQRGFVFAPIIPRRVRHHAPPARTLGVYLTRPCPHRPVRNHCRCRVDLHAGRVVTVLLPLRPIDTPAVAKHVRQAFDANVPMVPGAVLVRVQHDLRARLHPPRLRENHQRNRRRVPTEYREVHAIRHPPRTQRQRPPAKSL